MANECVPYYEPAQHLTGRPTDDVVGCTFLTLDAADPDQWQPEGLTEAANPNVIPVVTAGEGAAVLGVAQRDVTLPTTPPPGSQQRPLLVTVMRSPGMVLPVMTPDDSTVTVGDVVESDATGFAVPQVAGLGAGIAVSPPFQAPGFEEVTDPWFVAVSLFGPGVQGPAGP